MKRKKIIPVLIFIIIIIGMLLYSIYDQYQIKINRAETIGIVTKFKSGGGGARYSISYSFKVNGKKYIGHMGVSSFKCKDGSKKCVIGKNFKVIYSEKNPEYNWIDLGEYDKYRTTVKFIEFE